MPRRPRHRPSAWLVAALGLAWLPVLVLWSTCFGDALGEDNAR